MILGKPRTCYSRQQKLILETFYMEEKFITFYEADELAKQLDIGHEQVMTWFKNRRASEKNTSKSNSTNKPKLFRPFSPSPPPVSQSSNASTASASSCQSSQSTVSGNVTNDYNDERDNSIGFRYFPMLPKKPKPNTFFRPFLDDSEDSSIQPIRSCVITPNPNYKPIGMETTSNDNLNTIKRENQLDCVKTDKQQVKPYAFSVNEFEYLLQQNIRANQQEKLREKQLAYISVSYDNKQLMSIPVKFRRQ